MTTKLPQNPGQKYDSTHTKIDFDLCVNFVGVPVIYFGGNIKHRQQQINEKSNPIQYPTHK